MAFKLSTGIQEILSHATHEIRTFGWKQTKNCITTQQRYDSYRTCTVYTFPLASFGCLCSLHFKTIDINCRKILFHLGFVCVCVCVFFCLWFSPFICNCIHLKWPFIFCLFFFFIVLRIAHNHKFIFVFNRMKIDAENSISLFCLQYQNITSRTLLIKFKHALETLILLFGRGTTTKHKKKNNGKINAKCQQDPIKIVKCSILRFRCEKFFGVASD